MPESAVFDHYEVMLRADGSLHELGRGAMGITYKAFDQNLRVPVALKVINGAYLESEVARQRFVREARAAAKLRHRHVASVFHLGTANGHMFYAMEFIDGETVDALIKRQGPLSPRLALRIVDQVARALNAAQVHGLVHRDIKPANLMLVREDDELTVKVIDFGLAKGAAGSGEDAATLSLGGFVGTPHFASPEQLRESEIDVRSDIYSLGVTLWYMLAGQTPFMGSMAQVMSQHLEKAPPIERLSRLPACLTALLKRMLAKDPAERQGGPAELRREIEQCMAQIGEEAGAAAGEDEQADFATVADTPAAATGKGSRFEAGATAAGRYHLEQSLGDTNTGRLFRARELKTGRLLRLLVLHKELTANPANTTQIEREVEKVRPVEHPNLLRIFDLETIESGSFLTMEWVEGFSLLEVLRARQELESVEVLRLLPQAADGVDFALGAGLSRLDLALHQIFVHFNEPVEKAALLRRPVVEWPGFTLKLNPLGTTRELSASETWAGGQTVVSGGPGRPQGTVDERTAALQALGTVVYELLGGTASPLGAGLTAGEQRYTPLANLSERGNEALRLALGSTPPYAKAYEFFQTLSAAEDQSPGSATHLFAPPLTRVGGDSTSPGNAASRTRAPINPPPPLQPPMATPMPAAPLRQAAGRTAAAPTQPPPRPAEGWSLDNRPARSVLPMVLGTIFVLLAGAAAYVWLVLLPEWGKPPIAQAPPAPSDPVSVEPRIEPPAATPTPKTEPPPPPQPPKPTRNELLKVAVAGADTLEAKEEWSAAVQEWCKVTRDFPDFEVGKVRLELLMQNLLARGEEVNLRELEDLRGPVTEAAQLNILSAMKFLGKTLRKSDPAASFAWFATAAAEGDLESLTQEGLMLSNGDGCEKDLAKATDCLREAAERGHVAAIMLMGECYLEGKNVPRDEKRATALFLEAAEKGNPIAMNKLGDAYHKGRGVKRDFVEAARWFSEAARNGILESYGNLGVLYMNGDGVARDEAKAVEQFKKGIEGGDAACMFYYAQSLEFGRGTPTNANLARDWYRKAAAAGNEMARNWCRAHKLPFP